MRISVEFRKVGAVLFGAAVVVLCGWIDSVSIESLSAAETIGTTAGPQNSTNTPAGKVILRAHDGPARIATGLTNYSGQPVSASCSSCHASTKPNVATHSTGELDQFHQGLKYVHGSLTCLSCHNATNYDTLRLADSRTLQFTEVMTLCSQCHGPQRRDYDMGLHGGMNGYWDLSKGGRTRNICINCHDPHAPAFPLVMPVFSPRDRISVPTEKGGKH